MENNLEIKINQLKECIKSIIIDHRLDITSLGYHITEALEEAGIQKTYNLISIEEANNWKEKHQK